MSKLSYEEKIKLYNDKKEGLSTSLLSKKYNIRKSGVTYLTKLIDVHGYDILRTTQNRTYSKDFKQEAIDRILLNNEAIWNVAIDIGLPSDSLLQSWVKNYRENGYNIVERKRELLWGNQINKKSWNNWGRKWKIKKRKSVFKSGARILKKIESRGSCKEESTPEEKVNVVSELRLKYPLMILLKVSGLAKSVYYYTLSKNDKDEKIKE